MTNKTSRVNVGKNSKKTKKVLFVATVDSHIELFHLPYLKMFKNKGWEVHVATNSDKSIKYCDKKNKIPIRRSPLKLSNLRAVRELRKIIDNEEYDIIHCHTPMGGVVARLAARKSRRNGTRVIYTAHGFHFYKGAPAHSWLMFYPVEKYLAKYTDTLITINSEDFERAKKKFGKRCLDIQYVPGVGVDGKKFTKKLNVREKNKLRKELGLSNDDKVLICVGRLDKNKNQGFLIRAMKELIIKDSRYHLLLVGSDELDGKYQRLVGKMGIGKNVHFLGFRDNISELMQIADVATSVSIREGLGLNLVEALMVGIPVVAYNNRGHRDFVHDSENGYIVDNVDQFIEKVHLLANNTSACVAANSDSNLLSKTVDKYRLNNTLTKLSNIYAFDKSQPLRILHIFNTMVFGGAENMIMNIYRNIDRNKVQFDFLIHGDCVFSEEIKSLGGRIYALPGYINELGPIKYGKLLKKFFRENKYRIIHCHLDRTSGFVIDKIKKIYNPVCISHAHCSDEVNNWVIKIYKYYLKQKLKKNADVKIACSEEAGKWVFDNGYIVIDNPVDVDIFRMNPYRRQVVRKSLGLDKKDFVIGTVGRLEPIKNQLLLIKAYKNAFSDANYGNVKLIIVGDGSLKSIIKDNISNDFERIYLLEPVSNIAQYYDAFDLFVMPSLKEGFSMVLLEAYCNGLPIIASSGIPDSVLRDIDAKVVKNYEVEEWAKELKQSYAIKTARRNDIHNQKYNVKNIVCKMEKIYYEYR